ncbi:MAG: hypothetical protein ABI354_02240 [Candidatus Saccharimonadales bacterium]
MTNNTQPRTRPPKDFDLPVKFTEAPSFVPYPARDPEVIRLRRARRSLVVRKQAEGLSIALSVLQQTQDDPESSQQARKLVGAALLGSAWHSFAEDATTVGRRRHKLFDFTKFDIEERPNTQDITKRGITYLEDTMPHADQIVMATERRVTKRMDERQRILGRRLGNGALILAAADVGDVAGINTELNDETVQNMVKTKSLNLFAYARDLGTELGATLTLAQLAEPDSPLYVHTRRQAPTPLYQAYSEAVHTLAVA